ncbi:MAG: MerR family transcriptional regulator [Spirochaetales bacterium]|nr:MerR family transcriptional regulator [Spirochaetales bacterium]
MEYRIGDFAVITRLSIKTLRYYHEEKLLEPSRIDPDSGYRYYSDALIPRTRRIGALREWGFSICEIREILSECSDDSELVERVRTKRAEISEKITRLQKVENELIVLLEYEKESEEMKNKSEVTIKEIGEIGMISISYKGKYSECGKYIGMLYKIGGSKLAGKVFNRYSGEEASDDAEIEVCLPVKEKIEHDGVEYKILPSCRVISTIHTGPYEELGRAYQMLVDYRDKYSLDIKGPYREIYIKGPGMIFKGNPRKYVTEVQMPLSKDSLIN